MAKKQYTPIRLSHLTSYAGVGSIVKDSRDVSVAIVDTRYWTTQDGSLAATEILFVERVRSALGIGQRLCSPPVAQKLENGLISGALIPSVVFPANFACLNCGLLHQDIFRYSEEDSIKQARCSSCAGDLRQSGWCLIGQNGELSDIDWHKAYHTGERKCEKNYTTPYLSVKSQGSDKFLVDCKQCNSGPRVLFKKHYKNCVKTIQPWIYQKPDTWERSKLFEAVQINDARAYSPKSRTALVIPPESRLLKNSLHSKVSTNSQLRGKYADAASGFKRKSILSSAALQYKCNVEELMNVLDELETGPKELNIVSTELFYDEYKELTTPISDLMEDEDFVTEHMTEAWQEKAAGSELVIVQKLIKHLVAVKRLKEIKVFEGFSRYTPAGEEPSIVPPDILGQSDWLPAIELYGEGIFISLDESWLSRWEAVPEINARINELETRYATSALTLDVSLVVNPRFILLHTLSHLLIRELEISSGYPSSSLKERIYSSKVNKMAGILIYTAVADVAGSLGGLAESVSPEKIAITLVNALNRANWCSLDPVCSEHEGQGPGWLNKAACHSCSLLPETSCSYSNVLLDRTIIKGNKHLNIPSLSEFLQELE
jgi:hypothetical protein